MRFCNFKAVTVNKDTANKPKFTTKAPVRNTENTESKTKRKPKQTTESTNEEGGDE